MKADLGGVLTESENTVVGTLADTTPENEGDEAESKHSSRNGKTDDASLRDRPAETVPVECRRRGRRRRLDIVTSGDGRHGRRLCEDDDGSGRVGREGRVLREGDVVTSGDRRHGRRLREDDDGSDRVGRQCRVLREGLGG
jgi:hypothetical protein